MQKQNKKTGKAINSDKKRKDPFEKRTKKDTGIENYRKFKTNKNSDSQDFSSENNKKQPYKPRTKEEREGSERKEYKPRKTFNNDSEKQPYKPRTKEEREGSERKEYKPRKTFNNDENSFADTKNKATKVKKDNSVRLNKYIASTGLCSRREADLYILSGNIRVNGIVVTELGSKITITDKVSLNKKTLENEKFIYILLNKPKGYVTSTKDPKNDKLVTDLVKNCCKERIYPVGRLDKQTLGVLLLTNDGELTQKLTHPKYNKKKIYHVFLDKDITKADLEKIAIGVELEDGFINADGISYADNDDKTQVGIEIHSGRNKIVRRIFEHLGYKVKKLDRVHFAGLTKKGLQRGQWRFLTEKEIGILKMSSYT